ncbi:MAG: sigma 54-interacting transcriptional regulator [Polyangiaceae bacterium]
MGGADLITDTLEVPREASGSDAPQTPGMVVIFTGKGPACQPIPLDNGPVFLGRANEDGVVHIDDSGISRRHVRVERVQWGVQITDLDSRNGTFVDGQRITRERIFTQPRVVRIGRTVLQLVRDIAPFVRGKMRVAGATHIGPSMARVHERIAEAASEGDSMLFIGPSGTGKEVCAKTFHAASGRTGSLVAVNCATIPSGLAERLLFGTKRGAYSGANTDASGYVEAAEGGTLFLDEVAELDEGVQAKLLRALETHEIFPLGATRPRKIDVLLCAATLKDLRVEINAGRFREDLYYRLARPEVRIPPLSERLEELASLVCDELTALRDGLAPTAAFVEACALLPWPGNIRELKFEVREAGRAALADGRMLVEVRDLPESAGKGVAAPAPPAAAEPPPRERVEEVLRREHGNVSASARALGWHRNQLRRWLSRHGVDAASYREEETVSEE